MFATSTANPVASPLQARNLVAWARDTATTTPLLDGERPGRDRTLYHSGDIVKRPGLDDVDIMHVSHVGLKRRHAGGRGLQTLHILVLGFIQTVAKFCKPIGKVPDFS